MRGDCVTGELGCGVEAVVLCRYRNWNLSTYWDLAVFVKWIKVVIHISEGGITQISEVGVRISEMGVHISERILIGTVGIQISEVRGYSC